MASMDDWYGTRRPRDEGGYDVAQICLNGHVINRSVHRSPNFSQSRCDTCGDSTITTCQSCNSTIRGFYHVPGVIDFASVYTAPRCCYSCGVPYPWTQRSLEAVKLLINELEINEEQQSILQDNLENLLSDTPMTQVAAMRVGKVLQQLGSWGGDQLRELLKQTVVEKAARSLGL